MLAVSMSQPVVHYPVMPKRPKLSLQTSELPISYGTSSRGLLTIATPTAAVTPTTFNTFNNTYDLAHRPSPTTTIASPVNRPSLVNDRASRPQSPRPKRSEAAYTVNLHCCIRPILKNTPFPRVRKNSVSASPRSSARKVFFPTPKKVGFRNAIEEEIVNKVYTARHSDFFSSYGQLEEATDSLRGDDASSCNLDESSTVSSESFKEGPSTSTASAITCQRSSSSEDDTSLVQDSTTQTSSSQSGHEDDDNSISVATPASTRKRRKWEWTLAPLHQPQPILAPESEPTSSSPTYIPTSNDNSHGTHQIISSQPGATSTTNTTPVQSQPQNSLKSKLHLQLPGLPTLRKTQSTTSTSTSTSTNPRPRPHSFDGSTPPRKRKADCLDSLAASVDGTLNLAVTSPDPDHGQFISSDSDMTKRDRAATL